MKNVIIIILIVCLAVLGYLYFKKGNSNTNVNISSNSQTMEKNSTNTNSEALANKSDASLNEKPVNYYKNVTGFYAEPKNADASTPGVVMIHEWWGLNQNIKDTATSLAKEGYRVLAVDLYGGKVAIDATEAAKYRDAVTVSESNANMKAAVDYLRKQGSTKIASLGWCFGGGKSLQLAITGENLNAIVLYYGTPLVTDKNQLANLTAPVLGIFGDKDTSIPVSQVQDFQGALIEDDIKNEIEIYPGVGHAFANPSGANYAPKATADAWDKTLKFLTTYLK